jgi:hypothetical protein
LFPTIEVRWFFEGTPSLAVVEWFAQGEPEPEAQSGRVDYYLRLTDGDGLGIKLRQGRLEVKQRHRQYGLVHLHQRVTGRVEGWRKWSFELAGCDRDLASILVPALSWIGVKKERRLRRYRVTSQEMVVAVPTEAGTGQGCGLELTRIIIEGSQWWSLGFEAFGDQARLYDTLLRVATQVFAAGEPPSLDSKDSYSYPRWLEINEQRRISCAS